MILHETPTKQIYNKEITLATEKDQENINQELRNCIDEFEIQINQCLSSNEKLYTVKGKTASIR
eukprot:UN00796